MPGPWEKYQGGAPAGPWEKYGAPPPSAPDYQTAAKQSTGSMVGDGLAGVGAGAIHTLIGAYKLLRMVPGVGDKLPAPSDFIESLGTEPDTIAGHVGKYGEQAGEFVIPASKAAKITEGAGLITRAAGQAAAAGGTRAVQTGGDPRQTADAAALGALGPVVGAAAGAGGRAIAHAAENNPALIKAAKSLTGNLAGALSPRLRFGAGAVGDVADIASALSGKVAAASEAAETEAAQLDDIARGMGAKGGFKALDLKGQNTVRDLAAKIAESPSGSRPPVQAGTPAPQAPQASAPPPEAPSVQQATPTPQPQPGRPINTFVPGGPVRPPVAPAPVAVAPTVQAAPSVAAPVAEIPANATPAELGKFPAPQVAEWLKGRNMPATRPLPVARVATAGTELVPKPASAPPPASIAQQLADEMTKSGTATPEMLADSGIRDLLRDAPGGMGKAIAKANYAGNQEPAVAAQVYEAGARADKAHKLADALYKGGIPYEDALRMDPDHWQMLSKALGVNTPSKQSIGETLFRLQRLEAPAKGVTQ
jgi:hypothetical protein